MTVINLSEYNTKCYAVTFQNKGCFKLQKLENISDDKNIMYTVNPLETFLGKSESCEMTSFSRAFDKSVSDGITILLEVGDENDKNRYVYIGGDMIFIFSH